MLQEDKVVRNMSKTEIPNNLRLISHYNMDDKDSIPDIFNRRVYKYQGRRNVSKEGFP